MIIDDEVKNVDLIQMLEEEKRSRINNDTSKQAPLLVEIIRFFFLRNDYDGLRNHLVNLSKKRNQSKNAINEMVDYTLNKVYDGILEEDQRIKLLYTLIEITEGKIFVEKHYAIAVRRLTEYYLGQGNLNEASKLIQDIQIETFGSVERVYKVDYILFQMRILLNKGDYIRMFIVSNKINRKHLNDEGLENLKVEFYQMMILYYQNENKFIEVSKCYKVLYDFYNEIEIKMKHASADNVIKPETSEKYKNIHTNLNKKILLVNYVMYLTICPPELETRNMLNELNIHYKKDIEENPDLNEIVHKHLSDDIVQITDNFFLIFRNYPIFVADITNNKADQHLRLFRKYLIQHNLSIYQKYFSQCSLKRISDMICVGIPEIENEICDMVVNKFIYAKINRISGTVNFRPRQDYSDKLNDLNFDLNKMLEKMENTCHLIHKENLKYEIK